MDNPVTECRGLFASALTVLFVLLGQVHGADDESASAGVCLFDTGVPSAQSLSPAALRAKQAWVQLPEDETAHRFRGDVVLLNDKLAAVLRTKAAGFDVLSLTPAGYEPRATLIPLAARGSVSAALSGVKILENNPGGVMLEAAFQAGDGTQMALQCQLSVGQSILEIRPTAGVARLRLQAASRYVLIPDFFGDDMVFTPETLLRERITLPTENLFLTPLDGGAAMLMCVSSTRMRNAEAIVAGTGERRSFAGCEVDCVTGKSFWLASIDGCGALARPAAAGRRPAGRFRPGLETAVSGQVAGRSGRAHGGCAILVLPWRARAGRGIVVACRTGLSVPHRRAAGRGPRATRRRCRIRLDLSQAAAGLPDGPQPGHTADRFLPHRCPAQHPGRRTLPVHLADGGAADGRESHAGQRDDVDRKADRPQAAEKVGRRDSRHGATDDPARGPRRGTRPAVCRPGPGCPEAVHGGRGKRLTADSRQRR